MKGKKGYKGYKNIDEIEEIDYSYKKSSDGDFKSNTLDFYSDDMAKKPVSDLFKGMKEKETPKDTVESKTEKRGYSRGQLKTANPENVKKSNKNKNTVHISKQDTSNIQPVIKKEEKQKSPRAGDRAYTGYSNKNAFDHRATKFSTSNVEKAKEENRELLNNKKELENIERKRKEELVEKKPVGRKNQTSAARKRQKITSYIRIGTICLIGVLLLWLTMLTFQKNSLAKEVDTLKADNEDLRQQLTEASSVQLRLQGEIDRYEQSNGSLIVETGDNNSAEVNINSDEVGQTTVTNNGLPTTHTVASGDNLSAISAKYYNGNGMNYDKIKAANGLESNELYVGQVLTIPE